jgi:hypothetical protein
MQTNSSKEVDFSKKLAEIKANKQHCYLFKAVFQEGPTWNDFMEYVEKSKEYGNYHSGRE